MPIYEYECRACGKSFEHLARTLTEKAPACPSCGAKKPAKQLSTFSAAVAAPSAPHCSLGACPSGSCCANGGCPRG